MSRRVFTHVECFTCDCPVCDHERRERVRLYSERTCGVGLYVDDAMELAASGFSTVARPSNTNAKAEPEDLTDLAVLLPPTIRPPAFAARKAGV